MFRNQWLRKARLKDFRVRAEIDLFTMEVDDFGLDWHVVYFPGHYSWCEPILAVILDDTRPVYGYHVLYEGKIVFDKCFEYPRYAPPGGVFEIALDAERACP